MTVESDLLAAVGERFQGKLYAFHWDHDAGFAVYRLCVVVDGESGYYPLVKSAFASQREVQDVADRLNRDGLRLSSDVVLSIVTRFSGEGSGE